MDSLTLDGKKGMILGVRTKRSIAWAITQALHDAGADLILTYEREDMKEKLEKMTEGMDKVKWLKCDVTVPKDVATAFDAIKKDFGSMNFLIHSIAFAPPESFQRKFSEVTIDQYNLTHQISSHSLMVLANKAAPLMTEGGSIISMTYLGGERIVLNYDLMGVSKAALESITRYLAHEMGEQKIRVNNVSAGPIRTPAAKGIPEFQKLFDEQKAKVPLKRNVEVEEVAATVLFLVSDLASGITGENIHVDCGAHALGF